MQNNAFVLSQSRANTINRKKQKTSSNKYDTIASLNQNGGGKDSVLCNCLSQDKLLQWLKLLQATVL